VITSTPLKLLEHLRSIATGGEDSFPDTVIRMA
jgi:hypothetical protein